MTRREPAGRDVQHHGNGLAWWTAGAAVHPAAFVLTATLMLGGAVNASAAEPWCPVVQRSVSAGQTIDMTTLCVDNSGHPVTLSVVTAPAKGTAVVLDASHIRYTAGVNASGTDSFTYRATDPNGLVSAAATATLVVGANHSPTCNAATGTVTAGSSIGATFSAAGPVSSLCSDPDGDPLATLVVTPPAKGVVATDPYARQFKYTANANTSGSDQFTFAVTDGRGATSLPATATITIVANQAPSCSNSSHIVLPGNSRTLFTCFDSDADPFTFVIATPPAQGTVSVVSGRLRYTANANASGVDTFSYRADDGKSQSAIATATVTIASANRVPVCTPATRELVPGASVLLSNPCSDLDADPMTLQVITPPSKGTVTLVSEANGFVGLRYLADAAATGVDTFTVVADDGVGGVSAPVTLTMSIVQNPSFCSIAHPLATRSYYRPITLWYGTAVKNGTTVRDATAITDATLDGTSAILIGRDATLDPRAQQLAQVTSPVLSVVDWFDMPQPSADAETQLRNALAAGLTNPTFSAAQTRGTREYLVGGVVSFEEIPGAGFGEACMVVAEYITRVSFVELNASSSNTAPVCTNLNANTQAGAAVDIAPSCKDADSDPLTYAIGAQGTKGTASVANGQLRYVAASGASGTDTFTYAASDGQGGTSSPATVTVTITHVTTTPTINITPTVCVAEPERNDRGKAKFVVTLSAPAPAGGVTVAYATRARTATANVDYRTTNGVLKFAAGEREKTIAVEIHRDNKREPDETFTVELSAVTGPARLGRALGVATISTRCLACDDDGR